MDFNLNTSIYNSKRHKLLKINTKMEFMDYNKNEYLHIFSYLS